MALHEPWPTCALPHYDFGLIEESTEKRPEEPVTLHPVLRLFARDLPEGYSLPGNAELLHILWCPNDHPEPPDADGRRHFLWLALRLRQSLEGLSSPQVSPARTPRSGTTICPCALAIEEITDHPTDDELPEELAQRIREWGDDTPRTGHTVPKSSYFYDVAHRCGMKLGWYQLWSLADPFPAECEGGTPMELLLQTDSMEPGGLENLIIGRGYSLSIHRCSVSPDHPHKTVMQWPRAPFGVG